MEIKPLGSERVIIVNATRELPPNFGSCQAYCYISWSNFALIVERTFDGFFFVSLACVWVWLLFNGFVALLLHCHEFEEVLTLRMNPDLMR